MARLNPYIITLVMGYYYYYSLIPCVYACDKNLEYVHIIIIILLRHTKFCTVTETSMSDRVNMSGRRSSLQKVKFGERSSLQKVKLATYQIYENFKLKNITFAKDA